MFVGNRGLTERTIPLEFPPHFPSRLHMVCDSSIAGRIRCPSLEDEHGERASLVCIPIQALLPFAFDYPIHCLSSDSRSLPLYDVLDFRRLISAVVKLLVPRLHAVAHEVSNEPLLAHELGLLIPNFVQGGGSKKCSVSFIFLLFIIYL